MATKDPITSSRRALIGGIVALPALTVPVIAATDPHVPYREKLHAAFAENRASRPIYNCAEIYSVEKEACALVSRRLWQIADEVLRLPQPRTLDGLAVVGLAMAIIMEGMGDVRGTREFAEDDRTICVARAILAVTGEPLPKDFGGFGDEPGYLERETALLEAGVGAVPAWALAEAEQSCA